jgi:hypothetical protein
VWPPGINNLAALEATPAIAVAKLAAEPTTPVMDKLEAISAAGEKEAPADCGATSEGKDGRYCRGQRCRQGGSWG